MTINNAVTSTVVASDNPLNNKTTNKIDNTASNSTLDNFATNMGYQAHAHIGKVVCVGRNYAAHAAELGNAVPERPLLFIKPASSIIGFDTPIPSTFTDAPRDKTYPVHYEAELCLRVGCDLKNASIDDIKNQPNAIEAVTLGLDLTLRDLQTQLKDKGHPWERAKCFAGSCVLGQWVAAKTFADFRNVHYQLWINDTLQQDGNTALMLFDVYALLSEISHAFGLQKGDVVMTGTPSGVGVLTAGDELKLILGGHTWTLFVE